MPRLKFREYSIFHWLAAMYFFTFKPVQVWDKTYYQLTPNVELKKKLEENRDLTIAAAKSLARRDSKEFGNKKTIGRKNGTFQ